MRVQDRGVAMVYQQFINYPSMTVYNNIASPMRLLGKSKTEIDHAVRKAADLMQLSGMLDRKPLELSGGQQQRVLLAQRLIRDPRLLILDEPTSALDLHHQLEVLEQLQRLAQSRLVLAALHDLTFAARYADQTVFLETGRRAVAGPTSQVLRSPCLDRAYHIDSEILRDRDGGPVFVAHQARSPKY